MEFFEESAMILFPVRIIESRTGFVEVPNVRQRGAFF